MPYAVTFTINIDKSICGEGTDTSRLAIVPLGGLSSLQCAPAPRHIAGCLSTGAMTESERGVEL